MTTTIELIEWLEEQARIIRGAFENGTTNEWSDKTQEAAHRLRELDKPECTFTMCSDDSPTPNTLESSCDGAVLWYMGNPGENKLPKFCWHCGGAVKAAT
jgi:hypothetical protein